MKTIMLILSVLSIMIFGMIGFVSAENNTQGLIGINCQNHPGCANAINKGVDSTNGCIIWECPEENTTNVNINCYKNEDCGGTTSTTAYCSENSICSTTTTSSCLNPGTSESECSSITAAACSTPCIYGCENGQCIEIKNETKCIDTDGGNDYYKKGYISGDLSVFGTGYEGKTGQVYDFCVQMDENGKYPWVDEPLGDNRWNRHEVASCEKNCAIYEMSCKDNTIWSVVPACPNACKNGACVKEKHQCSSNSDCPISSEKIYCDGNAACYSAITYSCINEKCVAGSGGGTCQICQKDCYNGVCMQEEIKEQVKCVFANSDSIQKCYTAEQNSRAYCSGKEACVTDISGYKGEQITWKSTCGGYAYTIMDGNEEYVKFDCKNIAICQPTKCDDGSVYDCKIDNRQCICPTCPPIIVRPVCGNDICESGEGEICFATAASTMCEEGKECKVSPSTCKIVCPEDCKATEGIYANINEKFKLQVYQSAKVRENEKDIMKITFKDLIAYKCEEETTTTRIVKEKVAVAEAAITGRAVAEIAPTIASGGAGTLAQSTEILKCVSAGPKALLDVGVIVNGEIRKNMILNLGLGEKKQAGELTVSFLSYDYASRTGTFLISRETFICKSGCRCDENGNVIECPVEECEKGYTLCHDGICRKKCEIITEDCKYGCMSDGKCFPMGVRANGLYCGSDLVMGSQKASDEKCDNNFECSTNVCVDGKCVSSGLIQKIFGWFKKLFG